MDEDEDLDSLFDYNWGFSDEYTTCHECYNAIRTSPDSYGWQPEFWLGDGFILCKDCTKECPEEYLEDKINNHRSFVNQYLAHPEGHGFEAVDIDFSNGLHYGMNSDPEAIGDILAAAEIEYLFTAYPSQFYTDFTVWVRTEDHKHASELLESGETDLPYDIATETSKALKGEHSEHIQVTTYHISQEDFIDGNIPGGHNG